ncbi:uncharacterized protein LOC127855070 [Dreissena polymorpha]|uniref:Secreted protein n=1 Tax=Dreissena polymorpha TaxID=45954 RepID=A0A9D4C560_DREPO|nr:uncharacterized protein LOC127855070 [Dreissena polymorpha]KAH3717612.1 hypothetical protein DPMN_060405 [Dreissena polymorpha]
MKLIKALTALGCVLCVSGSGGNVLVNLFQTEIKDCLTENGILPVFHKDTFVRLILATVQNAETFRNVMKCAALRVKLDPKHTLHSTMHLFDINVTPDIVSNMYSNTHLDDWNCLQGSLVTSQCIDMTPLGTSCRERLLTANATCTQLMSTWNCTGAVNAIIQNVVMMMFGKCLYDTSDMSTSITKTTVLTMDHLPTTSPLPDIELIFESGFIKCSVQMFASEFMSLPFLFPPSQQTLDDILFEADNDVNVTARHERIKGIFCSKVADWTSCVQNRLRTDTGNKINKWLSPFVNIDGLGLQMKTYCDKSHQVTSMYVCTLAKTKNSTCNGGIMDVLDEISTKPFDPNQYGDKCGELRRRIKCRVTELSGCNMEYASTMDLFLNGLLKDDCKAGANFTESLDNGGRGDSTSKPSGQGGRNGAGSNKVARSLTMTIVLLAVGFVAVMRK